MQNGERETEVKDFFFLEIARFKLFNSVRWASRQQHIARRLHPPWADMTSHF